MLLQCSRPHPAFSRARHLERERHTFLQYDKLLALALQHVAAHDPSTIELLQLAKHSTSMKAELFNLGSIFWAL